MRNIDSQVRAIDSAISRMDEKCRIIWIQSWDRSSLKKLLNSSAAFFGTIMDKCTPEIKAKSAKIQGNDYLDFLEKNGLIKEYNQYIKMKKETRKSMDDRVVCIYFNDFHVYESSSSRILHEFLCDTMFIGNILLLGSIESAVPVGFEDEILLIKLNEPSTADIEDIVRLTIENNPSLVQSISKHITGYSENEVHSIMHYLKSNDLLRDNESSRKGREAFFKKYKGDKLTQDGILKIEWLSEKDDIGSGMTKYAKWIERHKMSFFDPEYSVAHGITMAKGVLMTGLPGTGKTVMAKSTAFRLNIPYVELNMDEMESEKYGESEKLLRKYISKVDSLGKSLVCIDEIEKSLGNSGNNMHEVKRQQLQMLLKWMQRSTDKFFFVTCNNMDSLPSELLRDGRLSERFYAFMPTAAELGDLFFSFTDELNRRAGGNLYGKDMMEKETGKKLFLEFLYKLVSYSKDHPEICEAPFMTGANLKKLIEETNLDLALQNEALPYEKETFFKKMLEIATNGDFSFFAQSNFTTIAYLWLYVRKNKLLCVSENSMINPSDPDYNESDKKFKHVTEPDIKNNKDRAYEIWFKYWFKKRMNLLS